MAGRTETEAGKRNQLSRVLIVVNIGSHLGAGYLLRDGSPLQAGNRLPVGKNGTYAIIIIMIIDMSSILAPFKSKPYHKLSGSSH